MPVVAAVEGYVHAFFGPGVQKAFAHRVFAHRADKIDIANAADGFLPGLTKIARAKNMWAQIVEPVAIDGGVRSAGVKVRRFQIADRAPDGRVRRSDVFPRRSSVLGHLNISVVGSHPNQSFLDRRRSNRKDRAGSLLGILWIEGSAAQLGA